jgi:DUF4097 and DUF4098 domain-containing protein YvlB
MRVIALSRPASILMLLAPILVHAETIERTLQADPQGSVTIVNVAGEVRVEGWKQSEVKLVADLGSGVEKLIFESADKATVIKVVLPSRSASAGASQLHVRIPQGSNLSINTVSADQFVSAVRGPQRLQAVSGDIEIEQWAEEVRIKTISGDVSVAGHENATLTGVETVSGDVDLKKIAGEINLETVNGDMQVSMSEMRRGTIRTTNGDARLRTRLAGDARFEAEALNGDLRLLLRDAINADFDIETFNGDIENCFGPKPVRTRQFAPGNALRFKQGDGNARVRVKTFNGSVEICKD